MVETRQPPASAPNRSGVVFVSHEKSDVGLAREIRGHLESGGFDCWLAADDIRGPVPWPEQIAAAIDDCDVMLVVVSAHANGSPHVSREVDLAVDKGKPLIPVRVEDIAPTGSLDYLLRLAQWIDLFPGPVADHASTLHGMVGSMLTEQGVVAPLQPPPPSPAGPRKRRVWPRVVAAVVLIAAAVGGTFVVLSGELGDDDPSTEVEGATTDVENSSSTEPAEPSAAASGVGRVNMVSVTSGGAQGDGASSNPDISDDGRYVVFDSLATNLVVNDSGAWGDIFVHDRSSGRTSRVSQRLENSRFSQEAVGESHHPRISGDGRFVVFVSEAANLDSGESTTTVRPTSTSTTSVPTRRRSSAEHPTAPNTLSTASTRASATTAHSSPTAPTRIPAGRRRTRRLRGCTAPGSTTPRRGSPSRSGSSIHESSLLRRFQRTATSSPSAGASACWSSRQNPAR